jgi:hypothetical protein
MHHRDIWQFLFKRKNWSKQITFCVDPPQNLFASKVSKSGSPFFLAFVTSFQLTGVETVGCSFARSEYTQTVVLCSSF